MNKYIVTLNKEVSLETGDINYQKYQIILKRKYQKYIFLNKIKNESQQTVTNKTIYTGNHL